MLLCKLQLWTEQNVKQPRLLSILCFLLYISHYEKWPTIFEPDFRSLFRFALTGFSNFLFESRLVLNLVSDITLKCHKNSISIWLIFLSFRAWFYCWRIYGRDPNLRSCDLPRSVLVTGFSPENGQQLPVISGNIHVKLATSAWVGSRNKKQQLSTMLFGGSSLTRSFTNGCSVVLLVANLAFCWVYLICRLITYVYVFW